VGAYGGVTGANRVRIEGILTELGMTPAHPRLATLVAFDEATDLVPTLCHVTGEELLLAPAASSAWTGLVQAGAADGIILEFSSGFRSYNYQRDLIRKKQEAGRSLEDILRSVAPPGFSEHHTGEAVDVGSPGCDDLTASFAACAAFPWLTENARKFGWTLSYPEGNNFGYVYEPWHWKWNPEKITP
jgi:D-alanyl-D-alanine carboxypeptidase